MSISLFLGTRSCWAVTVSTALAVLACYAVKGLGATFLSARPSRAVAIAALASLAGHRVTQATLVLVEPGVPVACASGSASALGAAPASSSTSRHGECRN